MVTHSVSISLFTLQDLATCEKAACQVALLIHTNTVHSHVKTVALLRHTNTVHIHGKTVALLRNGITVHSHGKTVALLRHGNTTLVTQSRSSFHKHLQST